MQFFWLGQQLFVCDLLENRGRKLCSYPARDSCKGITGLKPGAVALGWWGSALGHKTLPQLFQGESFRLEQQGMSGPCTACPHCSTLKLFLERL